MPQLCHCDFCNCRNFAQNQQREEDGNDSSSDLLCLVCENARIWYKTVPTYQGCLCVCKCKLERAPGAFQCLDCLEENRKNHRRHRLHGKPKGVEGKGEGEGESAKESGTDGSSP
ncbi:hypothetical protein PGQ11_005962 [Apiospora arundinis]|uniref:Uncharacterized protein n=1 Tax=Apiospora arundinis TaxID=335852 RepID=A0ABR2IS15_9PEZI